MVLLCSFLHMCKSEGYTMSKRVRRMMELDILLNKLNINGIKELEKNINTKFVVLNYLIQNHKNIGRKKKYY